MHEATKLTTSDLSLSHELRSLARRFEAADFIARFLRVRTVRK